MVECSFCNRDVKSSSLLFNISKNIILDNYTTSLREVYPFLEG